MTAILEWTQSNVQQNIEQLQTPTMGVTINKKSTTTEPPMLFGFNHKLKTTSIAKLQGFLY